MRILILLSLILSFSCSASLVLTSEQTSKIKEDLLSFEGVKREIYIGKLGVPTLGVGQTLGHRVENKVSLWSLKDINSFFSSARIHKMSTASYKELKRIVNKTNATLKKGEKAPYGLTLSKHKYRLSKRDVNRLLDKSIKEHITKINRDAKNRGVDLANTPTAVIEALFDLHYRGGKGLVLGKQTPKINEALKNRNYLGFLKELFADSNSNAVWQNDARNAYFSSSVLAILSNKDRKAFLSFKNTSKKARRVNSRITKMLKEHPGSVTQDVYASVHKLVIS
ncbi:MAG TPA: hypothetical protein DCL21_06985 [Alphaproteobacteria bacterium]|nr:hypothetical protein [Alphaproteobacteria bacterium]